MFDVEDLKDEGYDLATIAMCCEYAMHGLVGTKSKEARLVESYLAGLRDNCEAFEEE